MSIDSDKTGCLSSPASSRGREGNEHQAQTLQRPSDGVSSPPFGRRYDGCWTFSTLPPEIINCIFGFWLGSVADVCTARSISLGINDSLLSSIYSSPYKIFMQTMRLTLDESNYHDSAMTNEAFYPVNLNEFDNDKRSFFVYIRMHRIARDLIDQIKRPQDKITALMKLQRLLPKPDTLEIAKDLLSQMAAERFVSNYNKALIEVLRTYPGQTVVKNQKEKIMRLFHNPKIEMTPDIVNIFINNGITIQDLIDRGVRYTDFYRVPNPFIPIIENYLHIGRVADAHKFLDVLEGYFLSNGTNEKVDSQVRHVQTMRARWGGEISRDQIIRGFWFPGSKIVSELIDGLLKIEEIRAAENLLSQITEPFAKIYWQIKIAIASNSLDALEEAKNLLMDAKKHYNERLSLKEKNLVLPGHYSYEFAQSGGTLIQHEQNLQNCLEHDCLMVEMVNTWLSMKIVQAFIMIDLHKEAREYRDQLQRYLQFQAQLEILKAHQSREEFGFAMDLAKSMNEKKDILLTLLITEYLKTKDLEKLARAIEVRDQITDPYYKIKVQILIIRASESEEDYSTAKTEINEFMGSLQREESREYWLQIQEQREELNHFQEMMSLCNLRQLHEGISEIAQNMCSDQDLRKALMAGERDDLMQELQECLMQEVQEELMNAYIQKNDIDSAIELSSVMIIDKLQLRDNCILNLIDELLKRGKIQEAKDLLDQLQGFFRVLAQIRIAKASQSDEEWSEESRKAMDLIDDSPRGEPYEEVVDLRILLNKKYAYKTDFVKLNTFDVLEALGDCRIYVTFNLLAACVARKDHKTVDMLVEKIWSIEKVVRYRQSDIAEGEIIDSEVEEEIWGPKESWILDRSLFNSSLERKEFQSAEAFIDLIPNPKLKFEALTSLIEAMFKRDA